MAAEALESYLGGKWSRGDEAEIKLVDPTNGSLLATVSASGLDLKAAVAFARERGGPAALRALTYADRAKLLGAVADVLAANRAR
jgi:3,4-dehydroadipyl-CoA semialdehyde dehydrogenase